MELADLKPVTQAFLSPPTIFLSQDSLGA